MKIVFDQGVLVPLRRHLPDHTIDTAFELHWSQLRNGELLDMAERGGYEVLVTTDQNLKYQQNITNRRITIVVLSSTSWPRISQKTTENAQMIDAVSAGLHRD